LVDAVPKKLLKSKSVLGIHESASYRISGEADAVLYSKLAKDVPAVGVDGLRADAERFGDFLGGVAVGD
jgi:hypothetical protein